MRARRGLEGLNARAAERVFGNVPGARLALVRAVWPQVVGPGLAARTEVSSMTGGFLRVRVADGRWMRVLHRLQHRILGRLRGTIGALAPQRLGFLEGFPADQPDEPQAAAARATPASPAAAAAPAEVRAAAEAILDAELRAAFLSVAARYLQRPRPGL
jgi:hypothetical protein